jgi:hypothetical protein
VYAPSPLPAQFLGLDSASRHAYFCGTKPVCVCVGIASLSAPDWSRRLPRPLTIPTVMKLTTLADVRDLVEKHLPAPYRIELRGGMSRPSLPRRRKARKICWRSAYRFVWCWRLKASNA